LKKFGKFAGGNMAILEKLRGLANSNPRFHFKKSAKACSKKILPYRAFVQHIGVWWMWKTEVWWDNAERALIGHNRLW
jgi:hypothetical protein